MADEFKTGDGSRIIAKGTKTFSRSVSRISDDFIKDVVRANILAAEDDACGVFNIGMGRSISIVDSIIIWRITL